MKMWAAKCQSCGKLSGIRQSKTFEQSIELIAPSETFSGVCIHCGFKNKFTGVDFVECDATVLENPQAVTGTNDRHETPSDASPEHHNHMGKGPSNPRDSK